MVYAHYREKHWQHKRGQYKRGHHAVCDLIYTDLMSLINFLNKGHSRSIENISLFSLPCKFPNTYSHERLGKETENHSEDN